MLAVAIFALGMIALGQCLNNCLVAQHIKQDDLRARQALQNRMIEIEAGAVELKIPNVEELKGAYEGMKIKTDARAVEDGRTRRSRTSWASTQ